MSAPGRDRSNADGHHWGDEESGPIHAVHDDRPPAQAARDAEQARRWRESVVRRSERIALRTRVLGGVMRCLPSTHVSTMSRRSLEHDQTMRRVPSLVRRLLFGGRHPGVIVRDIAIDGPGGPLRLRLYRPAGSAAALPAAVYFHGGGWTLFGGLDVCDWLPSRIAARAGIAVVAVDYRLAPQHPFPAAVDDALAAVRWVAAHPQESGTDGRLAVFGDSSGGNLAAVVALALREDGPRLLAQGLVYPVTSTALDDVSMRENAEDPLLSRADVVAFFGHYLGGAEGIEAHAADPLVAPLTAPTLVRLPPALVQVAEHDVVRDQGIAYAERLRDDRVPTSLERYPAGTHGWVTSPYFSRVSIPAAESLARFLRQRLFH